MNAVVKAQETQIVEFDEFEALLVKLENDYGSIVYDLTSPDKEAEARSDRLKVAKTQTAFKKVRLAAKEEAQTRVNFVNGKGKGIDDRMEAVKQNIKGQLDKRDQELAEHAVFLQGKVDAINDAIETLIKEGSTTEDMKSLLKELKNIDIDYSYEDRKADATLAQVESIKKLETMIATRIKYEQERVELEALRKEKEERARAKREEKIRQEAEIKAKNEAEEKAERERNEAAKSARALIEEANRKKEEAELAARRAEEEKQLAVEQAAKEEREKIELEQRLKKEKKETERKETEAKKAKKEHRTKIEREIIQSMVANNLSWDKVPFKGLIKLIADGKIKHLSINY